MSRRVHPILAIGLPLSLLTGILTGCRTAPAGDFSSTLTASSTITPISSQTSASATKMQIRTTPSETPTLGTFPSSTFPPDETFLPTGSILLDDFLPHGALARLGQGNINQITPSPDGKFFTVAGSAGIFLYRSDDFQEIWSIPTAKKVSEVVFSADGSTLAAAVPCNFYPHYAMEGGQGPMCSDQPQILILNAASGSVQKSIFPIPGYPVYGGGNLKGIGLSADGKILFLGFMLEGVSAWDTISGSQLRDYPLPQGDHPFMDSIAFSPDGHRFAMAFEDGTIEILGLEDGELIQTLSGKAIYLSIQAFSPDGTRIAVGGGDQIAVWNISKGAVDFPFVDPKGNISTLAFSPDGSRLISGDRSGTVIVWDTLGGHCLKVFPSLGETITGTASLTEAKNILAATQKDVVLWEFSTGKLLSLPEFPFSNWVEAGFISDGSKFVLTGGGNLQSWTPDGKTNLGQIEYPVSAVFSPDYKTYAVITSGMEIQFFDLATGKLLHSMPAPNYLNSKYVGPYLDRSHFAFSPRGDTVAIIGKNEYGGDLSGADLWDVAHGRLIHALVAEGYSSMDSSMVTFSPDGKLVAIGVFDGLGEFGESVWIFDVDSGNQLGAVGNFSQLIFTLSADDKWIATGCDGYEHSGLACLYSTLNGDFVSAFTADLGNDRVTTIGISPDSRFLAVGTKWGQVILWDTASGVLLKTMKGQAADITGLAFSPDGRTLASTSNDGTVVLWDLSKGG